MIEARFAPLARWMTMLAGASGFYMLWRLDAWGWFQWPSFWWLHAMVLVWLLFTLMLFVIEPLLLHRFLERQAAVAPDATYRRVEWLHRVLLVLSLITVAGAVVGMG
jgi:membrane protein YdbS with pleckstrin-like domain